MPGIHAAVIDKILNHLVDHLSKNIDDFLIKHISISAQITAHNFEPILVQYISINIIFALTGTSLLVLLVGRLLSLLHLFLLLMHLELLLLILSKW